MAWVRSGTLVKFAVPASRKLTQSGVLLGKAHSQRRRSVGFAGGSIAYVGGVAASAGASLPCLAVSHCRLTRVWGWLVWVWCSRRWHKPRSPRRPHLRSHGSAEGGGVRGHRAYVQLSGLPSAGVDAELVMGSVLTPPCVVLSLAHSAQGNAGPVPRHSTRATGKEADAKGAGTGASARRPLLAVLPFLRLFD